MPNSKFVTWSTATQVFCTATYILVGLRFQNILSKESTGLGAVGRVCPSTYHFNLRYDCRTTMLA